ncbi:DEAD/DEAH box helicase family protein [Solibacillus sp. A46]|uniref:DEAD/DEAH box helicase family protein n=1 Tax=Solibacillus faecavium TaxID=2762221 RepID=A0ABR8XXG3_9BACL|nr:DEAD/DEAH box helicase family protein [Solibacillus faecavium]MBD8036641.1 DEAD/DEAH box helicase family protein [Solibacillus faecavium]
MTKKSKFSDQLVLNQYMLGLFGVNTFASLTNELKNEIFEDLTENNISKFHQQLVTLLPSTTVLSEKMLRTYDENIIRYTLEISEKRDEHIKWRYFQYLSLLFTEIYLDKYFNSRAELLEDLNESLNKINQTLSKKEQINPYEETDLKKLAFWNATGSGKTLIMHVNIKQYLYYFHRSNSSNLLDNIILLTPSEGLSKQHEREFVLSNISAKLFNKNEGGFFRQQEVSIIDIHKLKDEMGDKTVAIGAFEGNNLVLVDEGHRGSSGEEWKSKREQLSENGFAFEYSATFGQAVTKKKDLFDEYAKCILFDYSYRYFYADGYGKDYQILNLENDQDENIRLTYLTAAILSFYQQQKIYGDNHRNFSAFLLEKPLWIFVGGSVNSLRTVKGKKVSDVTDILLFLAHFIKNDRESISIIESLVKGKSGLVNSNNQEIFKNAFPYIAELNLTTEEIYLDIIQTLFNSNVMNTTLRVEKLKGQDGELALRLGESEPFGLINVGDSNDLWKLCEQYPELITIERHFSESYFQSINTKDSSINLLIGSKKFTEGWSSWRVSSMGLMNIGKSEGSQIIQLFGRGVRLKGYQYGLKRSSALNMVLPDIQNIKYLKYNETLNIFGIRADYMQQFKEYLEDEGIATEIEFEELILPTIPTYAKRKLKLKALRLKDGINFKLNGPKPELKKPDGEMFTSQKVILNWYPKIQFKSSHKNNLSLSPVVLHETTFKPYHIEFMNMDSIYFELQHFKNERTWHNLILSKQKIWELLLDDSWYVLQIPEKEMKFNSFKQVRYWEEIAISLLKKYCEKYYLFAKKQYEAPHMEYYEIDEDDKNFINEYQVLADKESEQTLIVELKKLKAALDKKELLEIEFGQFKSFKYENHLYEPLISYDGKSSTVKIKPVSLNKDEHQFLIDLRNYYEMHSSFFNNKELYVLRNQSRGRGIGFFEAGNFHPDFIIWLVSEGKQFITFADPKGIRNLSIDDPKVEFASTIKELEAELADPNVVLNSFIISNTPFELLINTGTTLTKEEMNQKHILFQYDDENTYIQKMFDAIK